MQINEKRGPFYYIGIRVIRLLDLLDEREIKRGLIWLKSTLDRSFLFFFPRIELIYLKFQVVKTIDDDDETEIKREKKRSEF